VIASIAAAKKTPPVRAGRKARDLDGASESQRLLDGGARALQSPVAAKRTRPRSRLRQPPQAHGIVPH
jgi:hypothetical protein